MASVQELKGVLKETLENRGVLGQIKARIRAEVFNALDDKTEEPPQLSNENMLINELIREYLEFNNYKYSCSVMLAETGQPKEPLDHAFLAQELNISEDSSTKNVPLLYSIITHFLRGSHLPQQPTSTTHGPEPQRSRIDNDGDWKLDSSWNKPETIVMHGGRR